MDSSGNQKEEVVANIFCKDEYPNPTDIRHVYGNTFEYIVEINGEPITVNVNSIYGTLDLSTGIVEITKGRINEISKFRID